MDSFCYCGRRAATKTSWTDFNPGRRFIACDNHKVDERCGFFLWVDPLIYKITTDNTQVVASCIKTGDRIGDKQIKGEDALGLLIWFLVTNYLSYVAAIVFKLWKMVQLSKI